jgi:hypothetical protein
VQEQLSDLRKIKRSTTPGIKTREDFSPSQRILFRKKYGPHKRIHLNDSNIQIAKELQNKGILTFTTHQDHIKVYVKEYVDLFWTLKKFANEEGKDDYAIRPKID